MDSNTKWVEKVARIAKRNDSQTPPKFSYERRNRKGEVIKSNPMCSDGLPVRFESMFNPSPLKVLTRAEIERLYPGQAISPAKE